MATNRSPDDLTILKENVNSRIQEWIKNLSSVEVNDALNQLELETTGTLFERAKRLFRRLRGDDTAEDFAQDSSSRQPMLHTTNPNSFAASLVATVAVTSTTVTPPTCAQLSNSINAQVTVTAAMPPSIPATTEKTSVFVVRTILPSGVVEFLPISAARELQRAWLSEQDLHKNQVEMNNYITEKTEEIQRLKAEILCQKAENKSLLSRNTDAENLIKDLRWQLRNVVSNAQQRENENALRSKINRSAKSVQFQETFDLNYYDTPGQYNSQNLNETELRNAHAPMLHSTAKVFQPSASRATQIPLSRCLNTSAPQHPDVHWPAATVSNQPVSSSWEGGWSQANKSPLSQPNLQATYQTAGVAPSGTWNTPDTFRPRTKNLGRTVRNWKLKFSGEEGVSVEEFLEQVEANQRLDNISDGELLDYMFPLLEEPALSWYRTLRPSWQTYEDFKKAALNNYSKTKRNKRSLVVEAHLRTQRADEPVRDYIVSLLTILSRFEQPWSRQEQFNLVIDNMLPKFKKRMKKYYGVLMNTQELLDRAQEAEDDEDGQWKPPPPADQTVLPEAAYRPNKTSKTKQVSIASVNANASSLSDADFEKRSDMLFKKRYPELNSASRMNPGSRKNSSENKTSSTEAETSPKKKKDDSNQAPSRGGGRGRGGSGRGGWQRGGNRSDEITPKSDRNKDKDPGPDGDKVLCWNCSWPGYTKSTCPECASSQPSENEEESE